MKVFVTEKRIEGLPEVELLLSTSHLSSKLSYGKLLEQLRSIKRDDEYQERLSSYKLMRFRENCVKLLQTKRFVVFQEICPVKMLCFLFDMHNRMLV